MHKSKINRVIKIKYAENITLKKAKEKMLLTMVERISRQSDIRIIERQDPNLRQPGDVLTPK